MVLRVETELTCTRPATVQRVCAHQAASGGDGTKSEAGAETEASRKRKRREEKAAAKSNKKAREKFNF